MMINITLSDNGLLLTTIHTNNTHNNVRHTNLNLSEFVMK